MAEGNEKFARILSHNKLISDEHLKRAREQFDQQKLEESFPVFLVQAGFITPQVKEAVEGALAKQQQDGTQTATKKSSSSRNSGTRELIRERRKWKPRSQRMAKIVERSDRIRRGEEVEEEASGKKEDAVTTADSSTAEMDRFISRISPSRKHQRMLQFCVQTRVNVYSEEEMDKNLEDIDQNTVAAISRQWIQHGMVRKLGQRTYNFCPNDTMKSLADDFLKAWNDPRQHSAMVQKVMEHEQK